MTRRMLTKRLRARLQAERGFTIVETVVAITVIFGSLTALAYTATIGFRYIAFGRDRMQATGFANEVMEGVRALPYSAITKGLDTAEYSSDPNIEYCAGDGTYRLFGCTVGVNEKLVGQTFSGGYAEDWIVPHTNTTTTENGLELTWATYVTNDDVTANPYSVTVQVSWQGGGAIANNANNFVRVQSAFWSPTGCVSSTTHPFAAPCQPFLYGQAVLPASNITLVGQFHEYVVDFEQGTVVMPSAEASLQQEQTTTLDASVTTSHAEVVDSSGRVQDGQVQTVWAADSDPSTDTTATAGGSATAGPGAYLERLLTDAGGSIGGQLTAPTGDTATAGLSTTAKLADTFACPPSGTRETDSLPCTGAQTQLGGAMTVVAPLSQAVTTLGPATLVKIGAPSTSSTVGVERDISGTTGDDGLVDSTATRTLGTIYIGGFPTAGMTAPPGMSVSSSADNNYCLRISGYQDTVRAVAGERTAIAPAAPPPVGTLHYYSGGSYLNKSVTDASLSSLPITCSPPAQTVSGKTVTWSVTVTPGEIVPSSTSTTSTNDPSNSQIKWETEARTTPIMVTVHYELLVSGQIEPEVDVTMTVDLGELVAQSVYEPPPEFGI